MRFDVARGSALLGSRRRVLAARSRSARRPARRPSQRTTSLSSFRSTVWRYWRENGRHDLPWRKTDDPYKILVSEVMLQQTQVDRVIPKYKEFLRAFPTIRSLGKAPLLDVLKIWSGLGYNRRAKFLRDAAIQIIEKHNARLPTVYSALVELPGIGDYTARAVRVFAFNEPDALIETNIRTAVIHHLFADKVGINDRSIYQKCKKLANLKKNREWHWALMDYGAYLKRSGVRNNHRSAHYVKQSKFEGSLRQVRGAIVKAVAEREGMREVKQRFSNQFERAFRSLANDGLIPQN